MKQSWGILRAKTAAWKGNKAHLRVQVDFSHCCHSYQGDSLSFITQNIVYNKMRSGRIFCPKRWIFKNGILVIGTGGYRSFGPQISTVELLFIVLGVFRKTLSLEATLTFSVLSEAF